MKKLLIISLLSISLPALAQEPQDSSNFDPHKIMDMNFSKPDMNHRLGIDVESFNNFAEIPDDQELEEPVEIPQKRVIIENMGVRPFAQCPTGTKIITGGCEFNVGLEGWSKSFPHDNGWRCSAYYTYANSKAYAICE